MTSYDISGEGWIFVWNFKMEFYLLLWSFCQQFYLPFSSVLLDQPSSPRPTRALRNTRRLCGLNNRWSNCFWNHLENWKEKLHFLLQVVKSRKKRIAAPEPEPQWGGFNQGFNQQVDFFYPELYLCRYLDQSLLSLFTPAQTSTHKMQHVSVFFLLLTSPPLPLSPPFHSFWTHDTQDIATPTPPHCTPSPSTSTRNRSTLSTPSLLKRSHGVFPSHR